MFDNLRQYHLYRDRVLDRALPVSHVRRVDLHRLFSRLAHRTRFNVRGNNYTHSKRNNR